MINLDTDKIVSDYIKQLETGLAYGDIENCIIIVIDKRSKTSSYITNSKADTHDMINEMRNVIADISDDMRVLNA